MNSNPQLRQIYQPNDEAIGVFDDNPVVAYVGSFILGALAFLFLYGAWMTYHPSQGYATDHQIVEAFGCGYELTDRDEDGVVKNYPASCTGYRDLAAKLGWKEPHPQ